VPSHENKCNGMVLFSAFSREQVRFATVACEWSGQEMIVPDFTSVFPCYALSSACVRVSLCLLVLFPPFLSFERVLLASHDLASSLSIFSLPCILHLPHPHLARCACRPAAPARVLPVSSVRAPPCSKRKTISDAGCSRCHPDVSGWQCAWPHRLCLPGLV